MSELKIGFIGVGGVAQPHLDNLNAMEGVSISAVCDAFADRAQSVGEKFGATVYTDYKKLIAEEKLDAVYVCLIPGVHGTIESELVEASLPFYTEKPVHLDLDACQNVLDALEKNPVVNGVGYHWRYTKPAQKMKAFLEGKKVSIVDGYWYGGFVGAPWWRQLKLSGGQLVEQTTHIVDLARYFGGEVDTVYAAAAYGAMSEIENYDISDTSIATLKFDSGAIGSIISGCITEKYGTSKVDITVQGRNFSAWTNSGSVKWKSEGDEGELDGGQTWSQQLGNGDATFISAVRANDQSKIISDYRSGAQTLAVTLAANESMESGLPVKVRRFI